MVNGLLMTRKYTTPELRTFFYILQLHVLQVAECQPFPSYVHYIDQYTVKPDAVVEGLKTREWFQTQP